MKATPLTAEKRTIKGKEVRKLRKQGLLPVGVYGKGVESEALSVVLKEFAKVYDKVGETGLVELAYEGKKQPVLVKNVQIHPVTRALLHAELHAVNLKEKIKAKVPLEIIGEAAAVQENKGVLLQVLNEVEVEALPVDLPEKLEVEVSNLVEVNDQITVGDLKAGQGVEILTAKEEVVAKIAEAQKEEVAPVVEAPAEGETPAPTEGGEAPAEGEKKEEAPTSGS